MPENNPTKMGNWQDEAHHLYFKEHKSITEIAGMLDKARKTVSIFLSNQEGFNEEKDRRKTSNQCKRKEYQKSWDQQHRKRQSSEAEFISAKLMKRQHEIDVMVLSADRH